MTRLHSRARFAPIALSICAFAPPSFAQLPELREAVITATGYPEAIQSLPAAVTVITADDIRAAGAATVTEALIRLGGAHGRQDFYGGGEYSLDLRGFGVTADNNQVVVLDGQRLSEADLGGTRLAGIPIESVERIEILRGSGAVLYGEGATGGVIVITTRAGAGKPRRNAASATLAVGSFGLREARAGGTLAAPGGLSLDAHAQHRESDNHRDNFRGETRSGSLKAQWSGAGLRVGGGIASDDLDTRLPGGITQAQFDADPSQTTTPNDWARVRNRRTNVFAQGDLAGWELSLDAGVRDRSLRSNTGGFAFDYDIEAQTHGLSARREAVLGGVKNAFTLGIDGSEWRRDILGPFGATASQRARALYLKDDLLFGGGTRVSVGLRSERIEKVSGLLQLASRESAWELGASHPLGAGITAYARAGSSYRLPNVDEFSFTAPGAMLRTQESRDIELGLRYKHAAGSIEARLYRNTLTNEIGFDPNAPGPFGFPGANMNFDPTRRQGLEVDVVHAVSAGLRLRGNVAVRAAGFRSGPYAGNDIPLVPRHQVSLRADWAPAVGHRVSGGVRWVGRSMVDFNNTCAAPSHTTADVRYAYTWKQAELSLGVTNLFDRKYFTQAFGCAAPGLPTAIYPEAGRAATLALRVWL